MSTVRILHDEAMRESDVLYVAKRTGATITDEIIQSSIRAYHLERQAAELVLISEVPTCEPTRSILYRSAGWLAFHAGLYADAVEMANEGLAGRPFPDLYGELRHLRFCAFRCAQQASGEGNS